MAICDTKKQLEMFVLQKTCVHVTVDSLLFCKLFGFVFLQRDEEKKQAKRDRVARSKGRERSREREKEKERGKDKDSERQSSQDSSRRDREKGRSPQRDHSRSPRRRLGVYIITWWYEMRGGEHSGMRSGPQSELWLKQLPCKKRKKTWY